MDTDSDKASVDAQGAPVCASGQQTAKGWTLKLIIVAVVAAAIAALVAANWVGARYSVLFATVRVKAGVAILASVALGFVFALVLLWSVFERER